MIHNEAGPLVSIHRTYVGTIKAEIKGLPRVVLAALGGCEFPGFVWLDA